MATPVVTTPPFSGVTNAAINTQTLINALAITDTSAHDPTTDTPGTTTFLGDVRFYPSGRILYVDNQLNQNVSVTLLASMDGINVLAVGTGQTVNTATKQFIDSTALAQLANAYPYVGARVTASVAPSTGTITVKLCAKSV